MMKRNYKNKIYLIWIDKSLRDFMNPWNCIIHLKKEKEFRTRNTNNIRKN